MGNSKGSSKRNVYSNTGLPHEIRTTPNEQSELTINETKKGRTNEAKVSRRRDIIKIKAEINKIEKNKTIERINKSRSWFFEKINKIDKPLARLIKKKRESTHINRIRNEKEKIMKDTTEIQKNYYRIL